MTAFTKLPALETVAHRGCWNCPPKALTLPLDSNPHPGFGRLTLSRDGEHFHAPNIAHDEAIENYRVQDHEDMAAGDPDHDWRITVDGPMSGAVYQRHGEGEWVMVESLPGFA